MRAKRDTRHNSGEIANTTPLSETMKKGVSE